MLPRGYDPANYGGKIWWNEENPGMRAIWGTQKDYDEHISNGGSWTEYMKMALQRAEEIKKDKITRGIKTMNGQELTR